MTCTVQSKKYIHDACRVQHGAVRLVAVAHRDSQRRQKRSHHMKYWYNCSQTLLFSDDAMDRLPTDRLLGLDPFTILWSVLAGWLSYKVIQRLRRRRSTPLAGPPNPSFIFGVDRLIRDELTPGLTYEQWAEKYGPVYRVPASFGYTRIVLCESKAVQHFYSRETFGYQQTELFKRLTENIVRVTYSWHIRDHIWECALLQVGRGILWAEAEDHRR